MDYWNVFVLIPKQPFITPYALYAIVQTFQITVQLLYHDVCGPTLERIEKCSKNQKYIVYLLTYSTYLLVQTN